MYYRNLGLPYFTRCRFSSYSKCRVSTENMIRMSLQDRSKTQWLVERERAGDQHQAADPWVLVA